MTKNELLLLKVCEESLETAHRILKLLRFGADEVQPGQSLNNAQRARGEYVDLQVAIMQCVSRGLLPDCSATLQEMIDGRDKNEKYMKLSEGRGIIDGIPADPNCVHPEAK